MHHGVIGCNTHLPGIDHFAVRSTCSGLRHIAAGRNNQGGLPPHFQGHRGQVLGCRLGHQTPYPLRTCEQQMVKRQARKSLCNSFITLDHGHVLFTEIVF